MGQAFRVACVQTNSAREIALNITPVVDLIRRAGDAGAQLVCLPENVSLMEPVARLMREKAPPEADHPALAAYRDAARVSGVWLLIGSLTVRLDGDGRLANRSLLVDAAGAIVARYDKIHLFDVDLGQGESYRESATIIAGDRAVVADTPWGRIGLSVCYDLRFPQLYRRLAQSGADYLTIPAAFTRTTGRAHWHVLQRARAIETGAWVFAPAQCGVHAEGRETYGHSLIVDPWGQIVADGGDDVGVIVADVDPAAVEAARRRIPSLRHDRPFA
ncbi:MAG: carbon-nitrogen hydrolase family protein [Rhodospirillales bacterium]